MPSQGPCKREADGLSTLTGRGHDWSDKATSPVTPGVPWEPLQNEFLLFLDTQCVVIYDSATGTNTKDQASPKDTFCSRK